jgi:hypothetical protein
MLFAVFILVPTVFAGFIWSSYRRERSAAARGEGYAPEGVIRWSGADDDGTRAEPE